MFRFYYADWTYLLLVLPAFLLAGLAGMWVKSTFRRYNNVPNHSGVSGCEAARRILNANGLNHVQIRCIPGNLTDHYSPKDQTVNLSESVYYSMTPAAVGVAAHEVGHAIQHATDYKPLVLRNSIVTATNIGSRLSMPLVLAGLLLSGLGRQFVWIAYAGVALFSLCVVFQLVTLPTEFNASRRALKSLRELNLMSGGDLKGAKKVLRAAAMTYVAALAVALAQLLRLLTIVSRASGKKR